MALNKPLRPAVILVADRTLSADYKVLFEGIFATMQTTHTPEAAMKLLVSPRMKTDVQGRALAAPLGIRRVESALRAAGLSADDVVCATPESLGRLMGPWTKIVGVSSSDPLGGGMSNTTTKSFWKGELYTRVWTDRMLSQIRAARDKHHFQVVAGGAGAWQWANNRAEAARQGIDCIFEGYFETRGPSLILEALAGKALPAHVSESGTCSQDVKPIVGPSIMGAVELSRGCGNACQFCTSAYRKMTHLPPETLLEDLRVNVAGGQKNIVSGSEDFFRYGAPSGQVNFEALRDLLVQMKQVRGLSFMQIDHGNISSVAQYSDEQLREIRRLLEWEKKSEYLWVNMGVESANGHLVAANGPGKLAPFRPEDWEDVVRQATDKMTRAGFFSVLSLVLGLPGETPDDVRRTLELVKWLETQRAVIFPVFHEPVLKDNPSRGRAFNVGMMTAEHLELYTRCYEINFRWVPRLYWDNQQAGGVSWFKRALIQTLGKTEVWAWRKNFRGVGRQIALRQRKAQN